MKKTSRAVCAVLALMTALLFAATAFGLFDDARISKAENRPLAELPALTAESWFSASFAQGAEAYFPDHVLYRDDFIRLTKALENGMRLPLEMRIVTAGG